MTINRRLEQKGETDMQRQTFTSLQLCITPPEMMQSYLLAKRSLKFAGLS
jgi:hypothetical protein